MGERVLFVYRRKQSKFMFQVNEASSIMFELDCVNEAYAHCSAGLSTWSSFTHTDHKKTGMHSVFRRVWSLAFKEHEIAGMHSVFRRVESLVFTSYEVAGIRSVFHRVHYLVFIYAYIS